MRGRPLCGPARNSRGARRASSWSRRSKTAAARHGLHSWLNLREAAKIKAGETKSEALLRKLLTTFREHPGLGAYKGEDEPEWGKQALPPLERAYQIIKELDPQPPAGDYPGAARHHREPEKIQPGIATSPARTFTRSAICPASTRNL